MCVNMLLLDSINSLFFLLIYLFFYCEDSLSGCWFYHLSLMHQSRLMSPLARVSVINIDTFQSGITSRGATETRQSVATVLPRLLLATSFFWMSVEWETVPGVWLWLSERSTCLETMQLSPASSHPQRRREDAKRIVLVACYVSCINQFDNGGFIFKRLSGLHMNRTLKFDTLLNLSISSHHFLLPSLSWVIK